MRIAFMVVLLSLMLACQPADTDSVVAGNSKPDRYSTWASYAGSTDSAQFSSLHQITQENVATLEVAWAYGNGDMPHRCTPLVVGEVMYIVARGGVTAIEAATGKEIWHAPDTASQYLRGLVYWADEEGGDERLLTVKDQYLMALSPKDGSIVASFGDSGRIDLRENLNRDPATIDRISTMTPGRVFEDLLIIGSAVGDETYGGAPGDIRAYNLLTGDLVWTFHTIPHPGEYGYDTWPEDAYLTIGAANAWSNMAIDHRINN